MGTQSLQKGDKTQESLLRQAMEHWRKRLIDLTPRNPLLHSSLRRRRLTIKEPSPEQVWSLLCDKIDKILLIPEDWTEKASLSGGEGRNPDSDEWLARLLQQPRWSESPKARIAYPGEDLFSALTRLRRRVRTLCEDAGFWTLFLAFGLLRWSPAQRAAGRAGPETWESPLLLLPVDLEQESPGDPFLLSLHPEEEVQFNLALRVYLQDVEKLSLPEVDPENLTEVLETVAGAVQERGWAVEITCWLNLFSFHKMAIYRDLRDNEDRVIQHPVVQALAGVPPQDHSAGIAIEGGSLRSSLDTRPSKEIATVLPADSSQLEAVLLAREGRSLLVHGPPGTGKSQTIVTIIADALTQGKSVLFVSEKRAALEVVLRRLRQVGLEPFCLDLHNYKVQRGQVVQSVVDELRRGWRDHSAPPPNLPADLDLRRNALAQYVKAVHTPRSPLDRTPFWAIGRASRLPVVQVNHAVPLDPASLTQKQLAEIIYLARQLATVVDLAREGPAFPWWGIRAPSFTDQVRAELLHKVHGVESALAHLSTTLEEICSHLGLRSPSSVKEAREFHSLLDVFQRLPPLPETWTRRANVSDWLDRVREALSDLRAFVERRERLSPFVQVDLLSPDREAPISAEEAREVQEIVSSLSAFRPLEEAFRQPFSSLLDHRPLLQDLRAALERAVKCANILRASLGLGPCISIRDVDHTAVLARALQRGLPLEAGWLRKRVSAKVAERTRHFLNQLAQWQGLKRSLLQEWDESLLSLNAREAWEIWQRWHGSPFRLLSPSHRRLSRQLRRAFRGWKPSKDQVARVLQTLRSLEDLKASLETLQKEPGIAQFLGRYYQGFQTDPEETNEALHLAEEIQSAFYPALPRQVQRLLSGQVDTSDEQLEQAQGLVQAWTDWTEILEGLGLTREALSALESPLDAFIEGLKEVERALDRLAVPGVRLSPLLKSGISVADLSSFLEELCRCLEAGERFREVVGALAGEWEWVPEPTLQAWEDALSALEVWGASSLGRSSQGRCQLPLPGPARTGRPAPHPSLWVAP